MKIATKNHRLVVLLEGIEKLYALKATLCIEAESIISVKWDRSCPNNKVLGGLRVPGITIPFKFQAGSYYYKRQWEFRYLQFSQPGQLIINTSLKKYAIIRLTTDEALALNIVQWFNTLKKQRKIA